MTPQLKFLVGFILMVVSQIGIVFDALTDRLPIQLLYLLMVTFVASLFLVFETADALVFVITWISTMAIFTWVDAVREKLHGVEAEEPKGISGRVSVLLAAQIVSSIAIFVVFPTMRSFLDHLAAFVAVANLLRVVSTFLSGYLLTVSAFGVAYATIYTYLGQDGFDSSFPMRLRDFFLYSAFNMVTLHYRAVTPTHWVLAMLSFFQVLIGIVLVGIYLAGAFSFIIQPPG